MAASSGNQYDVWEELTFDTFGLITERLDVTSVVRLAACSKELYRKVAYTMGMQQWDGPCLLMPDPARWHYDASHGHDVAYDVVPLDHHRRTAILPFMCNDRSWVGMNGDWIAAVDRSGNWCLANVYTRRQIDLPSSSTCNIWRDDCCGLANTPAERYMRRWFVLILRKIVICDVPTKEGHYEDYKLIALFETGLAYLEGGSQGWIYLDFVHQFRQPVHYSDAIEHGGFIFAVDEIHGLTYCWSPANKGDNLALPFVIPSPQEELQGGRWFLARSADGERLMIIFVEHYTSIDICGSHETAGIPHDKNGLTMREYPSSAIHVFEKDPSSFGPGVFIWKRVDNLGTHSLFLGLNYPMNLKIKDGNGPCGTLTPFLRKNCVYESFNSFRSTVFPYVRRYSL